MSIHVRSNEPATRFRTARALFARVAVAGAAPLRELDDALAVLCGCDDLDGGVCELCEPVA
ncbi:MAG TPA: hypothetical protein VGK49_09080 [Ilumatobacteraceae bacterium]